MNDPDRPKRDPGAFDPIKRFRLQPGDLLDLVSAEPEGEPLEEDAPEHAIGLRIARVDVESAFATAYLTFENGSYLAYAARVDDEGLVLVDRFCPAEADYGDYWLPDELEGETGPPPDEFMPAPGSGHDPEQWRGAVGRIIADLGWYEETMQAFIHFEGGGYLTLGARASGGSAFLAGYFSAEDPDGADFVLLEGWTDEPAEPLDEA